MAEIATAYISLLPTMRGTGRAIAKEIDSPGVRKAADEGGKKAGGRMGSAFRGAVGTLVTAGAVAAIGRLASTAVSSFAELEDSSAAAGVVFGDNMGQVIKQSKNGATELGLSQQQVINAANTFGTYGKAAGLTGKPLADFATQQTKLAADMASFKGTSPEQAIEAIGAALRGESEPIRAYGVMLDDATLRNEALKMGLISSTKDALSPQNKTLAAQSAILKQTTDAQGDFARTSDSTANVQKTLAAQTEDLRAKIGSKLAPAFTAVRKAASGVLTKFSKALDTTGPRIDGIVTRAKELWAQFGPALKETVPQVLAFAAAFSPLGLALKALGPVLPQLASSLGEIATSIGTALRPVLPVVAQAVANLAAAAVRLVTPLLANETAVKAVVYALLAWKAVSLAGSLKALLLGVLSSTRAIIANTVAWVSNKAALIASKAQTIAIVALYARQAIATAAVTVATKAWTVATKIAAVAQRALNLVMKANPIGLIITAITLLVGALVWFFTKTTLGKKIVAAAWAGIKTAISAVANWWTKTAWPAINKVIVAFYRAFQLARKKIGEAWESIRKFFAEAPGKIRRAFGAGFRFLTDAIKGVIGSYGAKTGLLGRVKGVVEFFSGLGGRLGRAAGSLFRFLSDRLKATIGKYAAGGGGLKGLLWNIVNFIKNTLPGKIKSAAKSIWSGLVGNAMDVVGGVMKLVGKIPGVNGSIELNAAGVSRTYKYAQGGVLPGYTPGRDVHQFVSPTGGRLALSGGEAIMRPEFARAVGGAAGVARLNAMARKGQAFKDGGLWGMEKFRAPSALPGFIKTLINATLGKLTVPSLLNAVGEKVFNHFLGAGGPAAPAQRGIAAGGIGGGGLQGNLGAMASAAKALDSTVRVTSGYRPGAITATGYRSYHGQGRAIDMVSSNMGGLWDKLYATYGKSSPELFFSGRSFSRFGRQGAPRSDHWDHVHWAMANGGVLPKLYDQGGWMPSGGMGLNLSPKPEAVLTPAESEGLKAGLAGGDTIHVHGADKYEVLAAIEMRKRRARRRANLLGV